MILSDLGKEDNQLYNKKRLIVISFMILIIILESIIIIILVLNTDNTNYDNYLSFITKCNRIISGIFLIIFGFNKSNYDYRLIPNQLNDSHNNVDINLINHNQEIENDIHQNNNNISLIQENNSDNFIKYQIYSLVLVLMGSLLIFSTFIPQNESNTCILNLIFYSITLRIFEIAFVLVNIHVM